MGGITKTKSKSEIHAGNAYVKIADQSDSKDKSDTRAKMISDIKKNKYTIINIQTVEKIKTDIAFE